MASFQNDKIRVPFCKSDYLGAEINSVLESGHLEGGGERTQLCESLLREQVGCSDALLVPSCTAALEMMALALDLNPGDEVIMPSFTFVSTANAFALRGAIPVFVDIDEDTLNIDPDCAEAAITEKTRAIMLVHYAGVACDMARFQKICSQYDLVLLEDAAQAIHSYWNNQALGSFGQFGAFSFHHTKNISCGEGGVLLVNDLEQVQKAKIIRDKGTNRPDFLNGTAAKYEWKTLGSSYLLGELSASLLSSQLEKVKELTDTRLAIWQTYFEETKHFSDLRGPIIFSSTNRHNGHIFHLRMLNREMRSNFIQYMREQGIVVAPHYVPLHLSPGGKKYGRTSGVLNNTVEVCDTLVRLPIYSSMSEQEQGLVLEHLNFFIKSLNRPLLKVGS